MQQTISRYVEFGIVKTEEGEETLRSFMHWMQKKDVRKVLKDYEKQYKKAVMLLSSERMFDPDKEYKGKESRAFLSECLHDMSSVKDVRIRYYPTRMYAKVSYVFDHVLSDDEKELLAEAEEAQFIDGYGENPFYLFTGSDGTKYYLSF